MRSQEIGEPALKNAQFQVAASANINGTISVNLTTQTFDQKLKLMGFPDKAITHVTFCQMWLIPQAIRALADATIYLAVMAADESEDVITSTEFYQRWIDFIALTTIFGDETGFIETLHEGRQIWIDEKFDSKLDQGSDGLYLYAHNTAATDASVRIIARLHVKYLLEQRYFADKYSRQGVGNVSEGWHGYEWEESGYHEICDDGE